MRIIKKAALSALVLIIIMSTFAGCKQNSDKDKIPTTVAEYNDSQYTIAVESGTILEQAAQEQLPNANFIYVNSPSDGYLAVQTGKAAAYAGDKSTFISAINSGIKGITIIDEAVGDVGYVAAGISPLTKLENAETLINSFIAQMKADGILDDMYTRWVVEADYNMPEIDKPSSPDKQIAIATTGLLAPYSFYSDNTLTGYDIELINRFTAYANAEVVVSTYTWAGIISACATGKVDYIMSNLFSTDERRESIGFSETYMTVETVLVIPDSNSTAAKYTQLSDFTGATIGSQTGTMFDDILDSAVTGLNHKYYDDISGQILALRNGKVDAICLDEPVAALAAAKNSDLAVFPTVVQTDTYGLPMTKDSPLTDEVSAIISGFADDGTLDALKDKWFSGDSDKMQVDMTEYTGYDTSNGVLRFIHDSTQTPMAYVNDDGNSAGYEVELVLMIGKALGRRVEITQANFSSLIASVASGAADIAAGCVSITDERRESVDFPTTHYEGGIVLLCRKADLTASDPVKPAISELSDLYGKNIGVLTGSIYDEITAEYIKDAKVFYYNNQSDMLQALKAKKIDAFACDLPIAATMHNIDSSASYISEFLVDSNYGYIFAKDENGAFLQGQMNEFLADFESQGMFDTLNDIWLGTDESKKTVIPVSELESTNGIIHLATCTILDPFVYVKDGEIVGYDIDIITRFCREYGYGIEISDMDFSAIIAAVTSGKCDIGVGSISITEKRAESVDFSIPSYKGGVVVVVRTADLGGSVSSEEGGIGFFASLAESFNKTFIRENR